MELGKKLGEGAGSEAFAFGDGRIIKLFRAGTPRAIVDYEIHATRAAFAAGAPAPEVFGVEKIGGRVGMILPRYEGRSLLDMLGVGDIGPDDAGATMAQIHHALHTPRYQTTLWTFHQFVGFMTERLRNRGVPADVIERAPGGQCALPR